ncbi:YgaP family membrane protein [Alkalicoccobacillus porphyridii]|uniref:DUF2892 domain-containing protein n=1 Tax=Alkalicoccobacillus porphyridii TaxID=2597270 RepID=A0A553ZW18_9BACI|nr:DUF2892 domain-containing protein [Alkalicoccobacillus porphyridii]TSB45623.1 DUF2892 domain-containing protein [Alkalicoccobacillus porphyridii]
MKPNITRLDALMRITCGLELLIFATSKPQQRFPLIRSIGILCGAMKTAEGIVQFCPMKYMKERMKLETKKQDSHVMNPS